MVAASSGVVASEVTLLLPVLLKKYPSFAVVVAGDIEFERFE